MSEVKISNIVKKIIKDPENNIERIYYFGSIPSNQLKSVTFVPVDEKTQNKIHHLMKLKEVIKDMVM